MLRLEWTTPAADEFERNQAFYESLNPHATHLLAARVNAVIQTLRDMPHAGRPGLRTGTRERVVPQTPYIVVYRVSAEALEVLHVFHERQDWAHVRDPNSSGADTAAE